MYPISGLSKNGAQITTSSGLNNIYFYFAFFLNTFGILHLMKYCVFLLMFYKYIDRVYIPLHLLFVEGFFIFC